MVNQFIIIYNRTTTPTTVTDATGNTQYFISGTAAKDYVRLHNLPSVLISRVEIVM